MQKPKSLKARVVSRRLFGLFIRRLWSCEPVLVPKVPPSPMTASNDFPNPRQNTGQGDIPTPTRYKNLCRIHWVLEVATLLHIGQELRDKFMFTVNI